MPPPTGAKTTWETEEAIREELHDDEVRVSSIGPAGELMTCLANVTNDRNRQVGRSGVGAVMGSKNLKAIAIRGTGDVEVAELDELIEFCRDLYKRCRGPATEKYRTWGRPPTCWSTTAWGACRSTTSRRAPSRTPRPARGRGCPRRW